MLTKAAPHLMRGGFMVVDDDSTPGKPFRIHRSVWDSTNNRFVNEYESRGTPVTLKFTNPRGTLITDFDSDVIIRGNLDAQARVDTDTLFVGGVAVTPGGSGALTEVLRKDPGGGTPATTTITQGSSFPVTIPANTTAAAQSGTTSDLTTPVGGSMVIGTATPLDRLYKITAVIVGSVIADSDRAGENITMKYILAHSTDTLQRYETELNADINSTGTNLNTWHMTGLFTMKLGDTVTLRAESPTKAPSVYGVGTRVLDWHVTDMGEA